MVRKRKRKTSPVAKLTPAQARAAFKLLKSGTRQIDVAARFGMSQPAISNLSRGLTYQAALEKAS